MIVHRLRNPKLPKTQNRCWTTFSTKNVMISETQNATYGCFYLLATHLWTNKLNYYYHEADQLDFPIIVVLEGERTELLATDTI